MKRAFGLIWRLVAAVNIICAESNLSQFQEHGHFYSKMKINSKGDSKILEFTGSNRLCSGYKSGVKSMNITLPNIPISPGSSYTECDWVVVGDSVRRFTITFLQLDLPEPTAQGLCDIAYVMYGGYLNNNVEKVVRMRLCGRNTPNVYRTPSGSAWVSFVWTGRPGVTLERPVVAVVQFTLEETRALDRQLAAGIVCFSSLIIVGVVPSIFYCRKAKQACEFGIWTTSIEVEKLKLYLYFRAVVTEMEYASSFQNAKKSSQERRNALRSAIRNIISRGSLSRSKQPHQHVKQDGTIANQVFRISPRLTLWKEMKNSGQSPKSPVVILHPPKQTGLDETNHQRFQILQPILNTFPASHFRVISENQVISATSLPPQDAATSAAEDDTVMFKSLPLPLMSPLPALHGSSMQQPLATVSSEESFRAAVSSNDRCSTPCLAFAVTPGSSANNLDRYRQKRDYDSFFLDHDSRSTSDNDSIANEVLLSQSHVSGLTGITNLGSSGDENVDCNVTRNSRKTALHECVFDSLNSQRMITGPSKEQKLTDQSNDIRQQQISLVNEMSTKQVAFRCNLMDLFPSHQRSEEKQGSSSPDSDFTFVSSLTKSSEFEPGETLTIDTALKYLHQRGMLSESFPQYEEHTKFTNCRDLALENEKRMLESSVTNDREPVIVIDLQPKSVGSNRATCSSQKSSIQFLNKPMILRSSHQSLLKLFHPHQLDATTYNSVCDKSSAEAGTSKYCFQDLFKQQGSNNDQDHQTAPWFNTHKAHFTNQDTAMTTGTKDNHADKLSEYHNLPFHMISPHASHVWRVMPEDNTADQSVLVDHSDIMHVDQTGNICRETML